MGKEKKIEVFVIGGARDWHRIKYSGVYDFEGLLGKMKGYLERRGYDVLTSNHTEAVKSHGKDIQIEWGAFRRPSEYAQFIVKVEFWVLRQNDVIANQSGRKVRRQSGDVEVRIKASMKKNYKLTFPSTQFGEFMRQTYEKYIAKKALDKLEDKLTDDTNELIDVAKEALGILR